MPDLAARYARTARNITITALVLDGAAIAAFLIVPMLDLSFLAGLVLAALGAIVSIAGLIVSTRCPRPRPVGSAGTLLLSLAIIGWLYYAAHQLAGLATMH